MYVFTQQTYNTAKKNYVYFSLNHIRCCLVTQRPSHVYASGVIIQINHTLLAHLITGKINIDQNNCNSCIKGLGKIKAITANVTPRVSGIF